MSASITGPSTSLAVEVIHGGAMLSRVTAVLNPYDVIGFDYRTDPRCEQACVTIQLRGAGARAELVAGRLRRLVGVLSVRLT